MARQKKIFVIIQGDFSSALLSFILMDLILVDIAKKYKWKTSLYGYCRVFSRLFLELILGGFWASEGVESSYVALVDNRIQFLPVVRPSRIGIFLEYGLGEISFCKKEWKSLFSMFLMGFYRSFCHIATLGHSLKLESLQ